MSARSSDHGDEFRPACLVGAASANEPTTAHHPDLIGQAHDLIEVVADEQHCETVGAQPQDEFFDASRLANAEGRSGLVHDDEA